MSLGVPKKTASAIIDQIHNWERSSGKVWTVNRLKEIKQLFLHSLDGSPYSPAMYIALDKDGFPKGPISYLFRRYSRRQLSKLLTSLMAYSSFVETKPSKEQIVKFFGALEDPSELGLYSKLKIIPKELTSNRKPGRPPTLPEYCIRHTRAPGPYNRMVSETDYISSAVAAGMSNPIRLTMVKFYRIFEDVIPLDSVVDLEPYPSKDCKGNRLDHLHTFGTLNGIQEPGLKLRVIANPNRVIQCALEPLKEELGRVLATIPEDCTFDQGKSIPIIQRWLKEGRTVHSIDLSDATTRFPWNVTKEYLLSAFPQFEDYIGIMDDVSIGAWVSSIREPNEVVYFYRGQPLGLGPSFFAFALTHHCIVRGIAQSLGMDASDQYLILGDDLAIGNDLIADVYRKTMQNLGNKISMAKSLVSKNTAEFAGYTVTSETAGKGMKWRSWTDHSVLDHVRFLGKKILPFVSDSQRALIKLVAHVPKQYGGLGWSDGRSLNSWLSSSEGGAFLESYILDLEKDLLRNAPQENLDWHLRFLKDSLDALSVRGTLKDQLIEREFTDETWRQVSSTAYRIGAKVRQLRRPDAQDPVRIFGPPRPGYFPIVRKGGDPRPTILSWALVMYQALIRDGGQKDKKVERVFEKYFHRPYAEIVYIYNAYKERKLAPIQSKVDRLDKEGRVKLGSPTEENSSKGKRNVKRR